jgi:hypothetical protein
MNMESMRYLRMMMAYVAAAAACIICIARGHVHVEVLQPATYHSFIEHRCGMLTLACVGWAAVEMLSLLVPRRRMDAAYH